MELTSVFVALLVRLDELWQLLLVFLHLLFLGSDDFLALDFAGLVDDQKLLILSLSRT